MASEKPTRCQQIRKDLTGKRFGILSVIGFAHFVKGFSHWRCRCDCGREVVVRGGGLGSGNTKSCGCVARHKARARLFRHGHKDSAGGSAEYAAWTGMINRCGSPRNRLFHRYGGRGIIVCDRWRNGFSAFLADMGPRPSSKHTIDRINNDGNYEPGNCRWATRTEQNRNKSSNLLLTFQGKTQPLSVWCEEIGIPYKVLQSRIARYGWSIDRAFLEPVNKRKSHHSRPSPSAKENT